MADGALRKDVVKVLEQEGVEVVCLPESWYRLSQDSELITVRMLDTVSRTTLAHAEHVAQIVQIVYGDHVQRLPVW